MPVINQEIEVVNMMTEEFEMLYLHLHGVLGVFDYKINNLDSYHNSLTH